MTFQKEQHTFYLEEEEEEEEEEEWLGERGTAWQGTHQKRRLC